MPTDTQLTGGSCPLYISDQEFKASTLRDIDTSELDEWTRERVILNAVEIGKNLIGAVRQELYQAASIASIGIKWNSVEGIRLFNTVEGSARLGWQMCQKHQPLLSYEEFLKLMTSKGDAVTIQNSINIDRIYGKLNTISDEDWEKIQGKKGNKEEGESNSPK
tara:strand:- start:9 stop:497 length:489 start_codon:yes stop_codon:yes gene_type:complete